MQEVPWDSPQNKILGLIRSIPDLIDEMIYEEKLSRWMIKLTSNKMRFVWDVATVLSIIINGIIIFGYETRLYYQDDGSIFVNHYIHPIPRTALLVFGIIQVLVSFMILFMYLVTQGELIIKRRWRDIVQKNVMKSKGKVLELSPHKQKLSQKEALLVLMFKGPEADEFTVDGRKKFGYFTVWFKY